MIENLSDEAKSVLLAKAMGWELRCADVEVVQFINHYAQVIDPSESFWHEQAGAIHREGVPNYYDQEEMSLAWRVLNWAQTSGATIFHHTISGMFMEWWHDNYLPTRGPQHAQRAWLDKILSLCFEAGLIEVKDEH